MNRRKSYQMVLSEDDGEHTGLLFRPRKRDNMFEVMHLKGYDLSFGLMTMQVNGNNDQRQLVNCHLGSTIMAGVDNNVRPNVALIRMGHTAVETTAAGYSHHVIQDTGWRPTDLLLPYFFIGCVMDSSDTSQDYVITGNMEYSVERVPEDEYLELLLFWGVFFRDPRTLRPSLPNLSIRQTVTPPYFVVNGTEEV